MIALWGTVIRRSVGAIGGSRKHKIGAVCRVSTAEKVRTTLAVVGQRLRKELGQSRAREQDLERELLHLREG